MKAIKVILLLISLFFSPILCLADSGHLTNNLQSGDRLMHGEQLMSNNGDYRLLLRHGGNLVLKDLTKKIINHTVND